MNTRKSVANIVPSPPTHWVGDGFPVSSVISPQTVGTRLSPLILMDYGGPVTFEPTETPRGVDTHPHRGFETVTIVYRGELAHRDSAGNRGTIGPGDVQWMTAASGILHEEKHSDAFTRDGGDFEVAQLWVNLPASHKMSPPRYQELRADAIPTAPLIGRTGTEVGSLRAIAGDFGTMRGAADTVTPVTLWDATLRAGAAVTVPVPNGQNIGVFVRSGALQIGDDATAVAARSLALLERDGNDVVITATEDAAFLILGGEPIDEPIATYGPFVMNTQDQIQQALADFRAGKFGELV